MWSRRAITPIASGIAVVLIASLALSITRVHTAQERSAKDIWRKSVQQGTDVPMRARIAVTLWKEGKTTATLARLVQAGQGRYCMTYEAPPEARGRVVCGDGSTHWQYEPKRNLVIKTPLDLPSQESEGVLLIEQNYRFKLVSNQDNTAGRPAYLLELVPVHAGKGRQRRWIDRQNFKTLRIETTYTDGSLARTVTYQQATFPAQISDTELLPKFQKTAHIIARSGASEHTPTARFVERARALGLKAQGALGFQLKQATISKVNKIAVAQLLYTDGIETISIFVRNGGTVPQPAALIKWQRLTFGRVVAYHQSHDHTDALVWTHAGRQYTAVSHLEPKALQAFVRGQLP